MLSKIDEFPLFGVSVLNQTDDSLKPITESLEPRLKLRLEYAAEKSELVTIEGPLFTWLRPPVGLVVEKADFGDESP